MTDYPEALATTEELDDWMSKPSDKLVSFISTLSSPLVVLGAGGKMGPSLCVLAKRAADVAGHELDIVAVSRFSDPKARGWLDDRGVRTIACDLMTDDLSVLPDSKNVVYLVGLKFGTAKAPARTWAINTLVPARVTDRFAGSRIVALSTGSIYSLVPVDGPGSSETDDLTPLGEYSNACIGRERIFEFGSERDNVSGVLVRLNYATDLRYGVLVDIAQKIVDGKPIDVTMGYLNCIWQRDANEFILRSFDLASNPMAPLNLTGTSHLSVRELALRLGELMDRPVEIVGEEAPSALLSDASRMASALGEPETPIEDVLRWTAYWVGSGGATLNKPSHFQVRDGQY